ncbi:putative traf-like signal protein [Rosellinia necatrix]|uniref:Putative traf-like signal protein n=1 Tax=Rosellinia necatrix TaxID=77044 RepID=A0A1S7UMM7_ROSNE|nr:putative traf-like signal protein [Rosellinia necatrix]
MPPPNTPEEGLVSTTATLSLSLVVRGESLSPVVDLKTLEYEGEVDENLICPICRLPLVAPIITNCDHVFCQKCIAQAHSLNPVCPIDRQPLKLRDETRTAPKIVHNQLDNLLVRCPNSARGCGLMVARSLVENHVTRYCDKTLVPCPHPSCDKTVARKDSAKGCLHYDVICDYCEHVYEKAELEEHQNNQCPNRRTGCELCQVEYIRHKQEEHVKECPEAETPCKFAPLGCVSLMRRKRLEEHARLCAYRVVGPVGEQLAELRAELRALQEKDQLKERRIKFLENKGFSVATTNTSEAGNDINLPENTAPADLAPYESRDQYFLSLFETMEAKVERVSCALNEVEGRHSVMLFNETLPIKDQLTEIRSTLGVLGMHVRWLMNFRLQERGRVVASSPNISGTTPLAGTQNNNNEPNLPRRLSDSMREHPPRL